MSNYVRFMSTDPGFGVALEICRVPAGLRFTAHGSSVVSTWVDPKHAPAIALSVLEAAGWPEEATHSVTHQILHDLRRVVAITREVEAGKKLQERRNALLREFKAGALWSHTSELAQLAIDRIIELEDGQAK